MNPTVAEATPTAHTEPVNAQILAIFEDRIEGFVRDPIGEIAPRSSVAPEIVVERDGDPEFRDIYMRAVAHGSGKESVLAHKRAIDDYLKMIGVPVSYPNLFRGGRSEIKPSEISPFAYRERCSSLGVDDESMRDNERENHA